MSISAPSTFRPWWEKEGRPTFLKECRIRGIEPTEDTETIARHTAWAAWIAQIEAQMRELIA